MNGPFRTSVCLSHIFHYVPLIVSSWDFPELLPGTKVTSVRKVKIRGQWSRSQRSKQILPQFRLFQTTTPVWFTDGHEMMHTAWSSIEEVSCCFARSFFNFEYHTRRKINDLNPIWVRLLGRSQYQISQIGLVICAMSSLLGIGILLFQKGLLNGFLLAAIDNLPIAVNTLYVDALTVITHYNDVVMSAMASRITSLTIVYSTVYSGANQRKHQSSASLAFVRGIHRWPVNSQHKWPVTRKMFPFDDVIMGEEIFVVVGFVAAGQHWFRLWLGAIQ